MTTRIFEISHPFDGKFGTILHGSTAIAGIPTMVLESVGPMRHAVSVPFHDSQARGKAILMRTGWDERWGTDAYWEPGPYLHEDLVFRLIRSNVKLVGVDFAGIDREQLLAKGILILENLCDLKSIPKWGSTLKVETLADLSAGSRAVRAFVEV